MFIRRLFSADQKKLNKAKNTIFDCIQLNCIQYIYARYTLYCISQKKNIENRKNLSVYSRVFYIQIDSESRRRTASCYRPVYHSMQIVIKNSLTPLIPTPLILSFLPNPKANPSLSKNQNIPNKTLILTLFNP